MNDATNTATTDLDNLLAEETFALLAKHYGGVALSKGISPDQIDAYIEANWERICSEAASIALRVFPSSTVK